MGIELLLQGLQEFLRNDVWLLEETAHERAICHRIGNYMERLLGKGGGVVVDTEYNRMEGADGRRLVKRLLDNGEEREVVPDIIIHERGSSARNLLVVEVKKRWVAREAEIDIAKLRAYREHLGYEEAVFVWFRSREAFEAVAMVVGGDLDGMRWVVDQNGWSLENGGAMNADGVLPL